MSDVNTPEKTTNPDAWFFGEVTDGIFRISLPVPFRGLRQVNLWLMRDGDGWTMIDCAWGDEETRERLEIAWRDIMGKRPLTRLIVTHFHPDHMGNCRWICERWGLRPYTSHTEWLTAQLALRSLYSDDIDRRLRFYRENGISAELLDRFRKGWLLYDRGVQLADEFERLSKGDVVTIDGRAWHVLIGRGHSPEMITLHCPETGVYISGDQLLPTISSNISVWPWEPIGDPLEEFLTSLDDIAAVVADETLVLPSHRDPFRGAAARVAELHHHHKDRLQLLREILIKEGKVAAGECLDALFNRKLDGHQVSFAMGEALAHLNRLVHADEATRFKDEDGVIRFSMKDD